jgi:hypothetical protein
LLVVNKRRKRNAYNAYFISFDCDSFVVVCDVMLM